jgi:CRP-like cAMP-binding protein
VESWRLTRAVLSHLVATGAVAVGDDLLGSVGGGHLLSKVSRRFGEGIVNGALTARVGIAAIEVCRPLPFHGQPRPTVTGTIQRALTGPVTGGRYGGATLGPGQFFGEISFLTGGPTMLPARAVQDSRVLAVARAAMLELMRAVPEMSDIVVTVLAPAGAAGFSNRTRAR